VIVGAHALGAAGRPRYTDDIDVLVEPAPANARRVVAALRDFGFSPVDGIRVAFLGEADLIKSKRAAGRTKDLLDLALLDERPKKR
jgi:hypothetical protein